MGISSKAAYPQLLHLTDMYQLYVSAIHDKWVPVTAAWRVLRLWMEERPPIWRVAANKLNKQSRTAEEGWSSLQLGGWVRC